MHPDPVIQAIADRYGAKVSPDLKIRRCHKGESAYALVWDGKALVLQTPQKRSWGHPAGKPSLGGKPAKPVEVDGYSWPSQQACADALGLTHPAVSIAIREGRLSALIARRLPGAKGPGVAA